MRPSSRPAQAAQHREQGGGVRQRRGIAGAARTRPRGGRRGAIRALPRLPEAGGRRRRGYGRILQLVRVRNVVAVAPVTQGHDACRVLPARALEEARVTPDNPPRACGSVRATGMPAGGFRAYGGVYGVTDAARLLRGLPCVRDGCASEARAASVSHESKQPPLHARGGVATGERSVVTQSSSTGCPRWKSGVSSA